MGSWIRYSLLLTLEIAESATNYSVLAGEKKMAAYELCRIDLELWTLLGQPRELQRDDFHFIIVNNNKAMILRLGLTSHP